MRLVPARRRGRRARPFLAVPRHRAAPRRRAHLPIVRRRAPARRVLEAAPRAGRAHHPDDRVRARFRVRARGFPRGARGRRDPRERALPAEASAAERALRGDLASGAQVPYREDARGRGAQRGGRGRPAPVRRRGGRAAGRHGHAHGNRAGACRARGHGRLGHGHQARGAAVRRRVAYAGGRGAGLRPRQHQRLPVRRGVQRAERQAAAVPRGHVGGGIVLPTLDRAYHGPVARGGCRTGGLPRAQRLVRRTVRAQGGRGLVPLPSAAIRFAPPASRSRGRPRRCGSGRSRVRVARRARLLRLGGGGGGRSRRLRTGAPDHHGQLEATVHERQPLYRAALGVVPSRCRDPGEPGSRCASCRRRSWRRSGTTGPVCASSRRRR